MSFLRIYPRGQRKLLNNEFYWGKSKGRFSAFFPFQLLTLVRTSHVIILVGVRRLDHTLVAAFVKTAVHPTKSQSVRQMEPRLTTNVCLSTTCACIVPTFLSSIPAVVKVLHKPTTIIPVCHEGWKGFYEEVEERERDKKETHVNTQSPHHVSVNSFTPMLPIPPPPNWR